MAGTLTVFVRLIQTVDELDRDPIPTKTQTVTVRGNNTTGGKPNLAVAQEALSMGEVALGGWWRFANRSETVAEVITIQNRTAGGTTTNMLDLYPGEEIAVRLSAGMDALYAVAAAGTPLLEFWGVDD